MSDKKLAGVWIDNEKAIVVINHNGQETTEFSVKESIKHDKQHSNSNENAANNSEQTTKAKFFKEIEKSITNTQELFITGPGTIQEELKNHLLDTAQYKNLKIKLGTSSNASEEQLLEETKSTFNA